MVKMCTYLIYRGLVQRNTNGFKVVLVSFLALFIPKFLECIRVLGFQTFLISMAAPKITFQRLDSLILKK